VRRVWCGELQFSTAGHTDTAEYAPLFWRLDPEKPAGPEGYHANQGGGRFNTTPPATSHYIRTTRSVTATNLLPGGGAIEMFAPHGSTSPAP